MQTATITNIRHLTASAIEVEFSADFPYIAGQYLTVECLINHQRVRRCYSISTPPHKNKLTIGMKIIPDGQFSNYFYHHAHIGDKIAILPPMGKFLLKITNHLPLVFFAAGSGITPIIAMIESALYQNPALEVHLFYANRRIEDIMYNETLQDLKNQHQDNFILHNFLSKELQDIALYNGRLDDKKINLLIENSTIPLHAQAYYICGPLNMIETISDSLKLHHIPAQNIFFGVFTPSTPSTPTKPARKIQDSHAHGMVTINVILDGVHKSFQMGTDDDIIERAEQSGILIPYSCKGGMCSTCRCQLVDGAMDMAHNYSLEPWELKAGFVLACQIIPKSKNITLDFDKH